MALFGSIGEFLESQGSWAQYTERLEQFFIANDIQNEKKASILLSTIGPAAFRTIGNLVAPAKPADETYARIISVMSAFYNPKPLVIVQRYKFYSRFRRPDESISTFVAELRHLAKDCEFGTALENNLRDRLVCGVANQAIQKWLLSEHDLTFKKALEYCDITRTTTPSASTCSLSWQFLLQMCKEGHQQSQCKFRAATCHHCGKVGHIKPICCSLKRSSDSIRSPSDLSRRDTFNRPNRQRSSESYY